MLLAGSGLVKVVEKKNPNQVLSKWHEEYEKAAEDLKWKSFGVYSDDQGHKWNLTFTSEEGFDFATVLKKQKKWATPFEAIVEYVFSGYSF